MLLTIYTENLTNVNFQKLNNSAFPALNEPTICLIYTGSYSETEVLSFKLLLSVQEQEKAARFRFERDRKSFMITYGMLRIILGCYCNTEPSGIEFITNEFGKPSLTVKFKKIHFNLSHRSGISVLAFSAKSEIGIDIEKIDPEFDFDLIAGSHFSRTENRFIHEVKGEERERFYTLWTRKEALLKAIGTGIGENLNVEVFRKVNRFNPQTPFPGKLNSEYFLKSFEYQQNFIISASMAYRGDFVCSFIGH